MKNCPFCAEQIQDAAIVCKHCRRDLPAAPATAPLRSPHPRPVNKTARILAGLFGGAVVVVAAAFWIQILMDAAAPRITERIPNLRVSAGKGNASFMLTNRESYPISRCDVELLDAGEATWLAVIPGPIAPLDTSTIRWAEFKANGQSMPNYIGQNRENFTVSCLVNDQRRSAGVAF